jgi:hypothetical protein
MLTRLEGPSAQRWSAPFGSSLATPPLGPTLMVDWRIADLKERMDQSEDHGEKEL